MSYIEPITQDLINICINEFKKKENKEKIYTHILNPLIKDIVSKSYPYALIHVVLQLVIIGLLLCILIKIKKN